MKEDLLNIIGTHVVAEYTADIVGKGYNPDGLGYVVSGDDLTIQMPEKFKFVESGRKPNSTPPPVAELLDWAIRNRIPNPNVTVYAIAKSIAIKGIKPKQIFTDLDMTNIQLDITSLLQETLNASTNNN